MLALSWLRFQRFTRLPTEKDDGLYVARDFLETRVSLAGAIERCIMLDPHKGGFF